MKRIGIAASKISKGNVALYNFYVVLISSLFSFFILVVAGATVLFALTFLGYIFKEVMAIELEKSWSSILVFCMVALSVVMGVFNLVAIVMNIRLDNLKK